MSDGLPPLREVIRELGLSARKSLGQNYILDLNLTRRIARCGGDLPGCTVIEVGPGPGGLTRGLLMEGAGRVVVVERDDRFRPALQAIGDAYPDRLHIEMGDALDTDFDLIASPGPTIVISNLPYNVGTQLLVNWLTPQQWPPFYRQLVLMFQKEVAERIVAEPGSKAYGRLSVLAQWRCEPTIVFNVPASAFTPPPKVASAVVQLTPRSSPCDAGSVEHLESVTAAAFGQRRKMLRSSLKTFVRAPESLLETVGLDPTLRAEDVAPEDYCRLARAYGAGQDAGN